MSDGDRRAEGRGANLGEAKWTAIKELERRFPGLTANAVRFEVLEDTEALAHVMGEVDVEAWEATELPDEPAERVRAIVSAVVSSLQLDASVDVEERPDEIVATVNGDDLGRLIGKHGSMIDALQHLAWRAAWQGTDGERKSVVVDAAGYREKRVTALQRQADRAVSDALSFGRPVELEPMSAAERKIVHNYLAERNDVETHSEGDEPERRLVVSPLR